MKKKLLVFIVLIGIVFLLYVHFIHSFTFRFETSRTKASIFYSIQDFQKIKNDSFRIRTISEEKYNSVTQDSYFLKKNIRLNWSLNEIKDTITEVSVDCETYNFSYIDKLKLVLNQSKIKDFYKNKINFFIETSQHFKSSYFVKNYKEVISPKINGYVVSIKAKRGDKASEMLKNIGILDAFFIKNNMKIEGKPFLKVTKWDKKTDSIWFDFGFPSPSKIEGTKEVKRMEYAQKPAFSVEYYGNYIQSDQAWFYLYQKTNTKNFPLELFYNNPNNGGSELQWKAVIYIEK